jgi:hypothetical protein
VCENVDFIYLAHVRIQYVVLISAVLNPCDVLQQSQSVTQSFSQLGRQSGRQTAKLVHYVGKLFLL